MHNGDTSSLVRFWPPRRDSPLLSNHTIANPRRLPAPSLLRIGTAYLLPFWKSMTDRTRWSSGRMKERPKPGLIMG